MSIQRINLIGVPVDICRPEEMENEILELLAKPGTKQIIFLSIWDLLKARRRGDFADCVKNADLILVMNEGNIVEQGTHESLMKKNGFYSELYNSQFKK